MAIRPDTGRGGGSGVTPEQLEVLKHWNYNPITNTMATTASVRSSLNSFELAEMHKMHSGGENVFFRNNVSGTNWFSVWQGIKYLPTVGQYPDLPPKARQYSLTSLLLPNGTLAHQSISVNYTQILTIEQNESLFKLRVIAGEAYTGKLTYSIRNTNAGGIEKYSQTIGVSVLAGEAVTFTFTHPCETHKGSVIFVDIFKEGGVPFLVRAGDNLTKPWLELSLSTFEDVGVQIDTQRFTNDFTVRYSGDYEVSTLGGTVMVTVPIDFTGSFTVSDSDGSFNETKKCSVDFNAFRQGIANLQNSADAYKFYYNTKDSKWWYKNLFTLEGGMV